MIIIINKKTKKIINNMGTNSAFPDGNIPNIRCNENEEIIKMHDNSDLAKKILQASRNFKFNDDFTDIIVDAETDEQIKQNQIQALRRQLQEMDKKIMDNLPIIDKILPFLIELGLEITPKQAEFLSRRELIKQELEVLLDGRIRGKNN